MYIIFLDETKLQSKNTFRDSATFNKNPIAGTDSETKGLAIGNCPQLAAAHNAHAVPRARRRLEKQNNTLPTVVSGSRYTGKVLFDFVSNDVYKYCVRQYFSLAFFFYFQEVYFSSRHLSIH